MWPCPTCPSPDGPATPELAACLQEMNELRALNALLQHCTELPTRLYLAAPALRRALGPVPSSFALFLFTALILCCWGSGAPERLPSLFVGMEGSEPPPQWVLGPALYRDASQCIFLCSLHACHNCRPSGVAALGLENL